jgi:hypothetical protein
MDTRPIGGITAKGGDIMKVNTYVPPDYREDVLNIRSKVGWSDFVFSCIALWRADREFRKIIKRRK